VKQQRPTEFDDPIKHKETWDAALDRAASDPAYRSRLISDPSAALAEAGIQVPSGVQVTVVEYDPNHRYLVLPPVTERVMHVPIPHQKGGHHGTC
jgi:Nitrile hydratase, alpha chain